MNADNRKLFYCDYVSRENYKDVYLTANKLKSLGLNPVSFTLDGNTNVIRAILDTWSDCVIQRCLFHIQNQGLMWIRKPPKTVMGKDLRAVLKSVASIKTHSDMICFTDKYMKWQKEYKDDICLLVKSSIAYRDLKKTTSLIDNANKDMFHFIEDDNIPSTTNSLEGFFSHLKRNYRNHNGLSKEHKISYLKWYCYYKSI
jgi:transposase-like protein